MLIWCRSIATFWMPMIRVWQFIRLGSCLSPAPTRRLIDTARRRQGHKTLQVFVHITQDWGQHWGQRWPKQATLSKVHIPRYTRPSHVSRFILTGSAYLHGLSWTGTRSLMHFAAWSSTPHSNTCSTRSLGLFARSFWVMLKDSFPLPLVFFET